ncbi:SET domain-containing protein [Polyporus arcularius HHB13444]|uniref:Ribosomal lysine N-methyltransferase 4 n=1 Tax=Polyporus arcularius HHB13444 TaxID=1314778 RepID=A0A5C3PIQ8_9APHY|nr:SET domain-containing protein [Polyporus arcularius HHB13444]
MTDSVIDNFVSWFANQQGLLDTSSMGIVDFPGHGRGAVALKDIPEDHTLFSIPRGLTLSTRTSTLPTLMGHAWKEHGLHEGWVGLILCMMWEESRGAESKWSGYLSVLPEKFDTPMFWEEDDLKELQGTAVVDKIGRDDAERDYYEKLVPAVKSRPDLFPEDKLERYFSVERYHLNGSRILSRSFHVEKWKGEHTEGDSDEEGAGGAEDESAMDVDPQEVSAAAHVDEPVQEDAPGSDVEEPQLVVEAEEDDSDDEDREDPADVAMVPMADMLNARFESENAKLFYEERELKMVSTKPIKAGEQIWNTYGDPPNSDLLRRYGHVDVVQLRPPLSGTGNPGDVVEVGADLVVSVASKKVKYDLQERVDWWLEEADDDVFILRTDCELPEELVSFLRLLLQSEDEWQKTAKKSKLPKPKVDKDVLDIAVDVIEARLKAYPTFIKDDEKLLSPGSVEQLSLNKKNAVIVRLGEKRILQGTLTQLRSQVAALSAPSRKRSRDDDKGGRGKKARK